jgi:CubicO group peptidase (beta-lactamase class C family)
LRQFLGALLLGSAALLVLGVKGQQTMPAARADEGADRLEGAFAGLVQADSPGFAALVKKDGRVLFKRGFGVRDLRSKARIDARTNFRLASCSKQFTAMAIMLLVHDQKLRYDETLTEIFPEFPGYGKSITVRNLLNHTSGLPDYEQLMAAVEKKDPVWSAERQITDQEVLQLLEKESRGKFAPGSKWEYSNSGYVLLGLIVRERAGRSFAEFLKQRIFAPLGMADSLVFRKGKDQVPGRAYGHSIQNGALVETDQSATSATQGDGGVYSNLEDLGRWDDALRHPTLLSAREFAAALTPVQLPAGAEQKLAEDAPESLRALAASYGFGWFLDRTSPHPLMWHYGDTVGFKSAVLRYFDRDLTVIVLSNRTDLDAGALALEAAAIASRN